MTDSIRDRVPIGIGSIACRSDSVAEVNALAPRLQAYIDWRPLCLFGAGGFCANPLQPDVCGVIQVEKPHPGRITAVPHDAHARELWALLPMAPIDCLRDEAARENFFLQTLTVFRWQRLLACGLRVVSLQQFYAQHKYLVMSRDIAIYRRLGSLLAQTTPHNVSHTALDMIRLILAALAQPETRGGACNALLHIRGYLKHHLDRSEQTELSELIERYRQGLVPLGEPLRLLRQHFRTHPDDYIGQQIFLQADRWAAFFNIDSSTDSS